MITQQMTRNDKRAGNSFLKEAPMKGDVRLTSGNVILLTYNPEIYISSRCGEVWRGLVKTNAAGQRNLDRQPELVKSNTW